MNYIKKFLWIFVFFLGMALSRFLDFDADSSIGNERIKPKESPSEILDYEKFFPLLNSDFIQEAANTFCNTDNYVKVTLYPEDWGVH